MKHRSGGQSWSEMRGDDDRRNKGIGMLLPAVLLMLSGTVMGLFLGGQLLIASVVYASLIVSGAFGFWLCGLSTIQGDGRTIAVKYRSLACTRTADPGNREIELSMAVREGAGRSRESSQEPPADELQRDASMAKRAS